MIATKFQRLYACFRSPGNTTRILRRLWICANQIYWSVTRSGYVLPIFRFLISPTGRNARLIRTFNSSNDVFCFVHVPFRSLEPSNSLLRDLQLPKHKHFDPFLDFRFAAEIAAALKNKLPLNVKITLQ